jgi:YggT family protein
MSQYLTIFISVFFDLLTFAIIARVLLSWVPGISGGQIKMFLFDITEPFLAIFRRIVPRLGMLDISPIVALLALDLIKVLLLSLIHNMPI